MTALLTLLGAVVTVLLAVPAPAGRQLRARLEPVREAGGSGPARWVLAVVGLALAAVGLVIGAGLLGGGPAAVLVASALVVLGTTGRLVASSLRQRRARRAQHEVATACSVLASYLRVGQVTTEALLLAAQDCPVLAEAARRQRIGGDVPATWRAQARSPGHAGLADLARTWQVSASTGAPLSAALEQVATGLAADQSLRAVVAGELSAPRATGKVMAVLPLLGIGLGYLLGGNPVHWLLGGPLGWACLLLGLLLAAAGVTWIERLARGAAAQA